MTRMELLQKIPHFHCFLKIIVLQKQIFTLNYKFFQVIRKYIECTILHNMFKSLTETYIYMELSDRNTNLK